MTKQEIFQILGEPRKTGFSASTGQEVWYYKSSEE
jgi:outer membrane protein assembly factor BamE (lipoprotein component of BamABCDE complex)